MSDWTSAFVYAVRTLRRQPTFVLVALLTLAFGIGANTAIFSVIKTVVLNPLPYDNPERIAVLWEVNPEGNQDRVSVPTFEDWKKETRAFETIAAYRHVDFSYAGSGDPRNVPGVRATPELFTVLRAKPASDAHSSPPEAIVGNDRVVVVSHGFWTRVLGSNPNIVGSAIKLDTLPFTVVGVMPPGFEFPTATTVEAWAPLAFDPKDLHGAIPPRPIADGRGPARHRYHDAAGAKRDGAARTAHCSGEFKDSNAGWSARVVAAHEQLVAASRPALLVLMGAVGILLLIVCANMANLLLARLSSRRREVAVRVALGANRWDVARPIVAESLLLLLRWRCCSVNSPRGGGGTAFADHIARRAGLPRIDQIHLDGSVLFFAAVISVGVALAFGIGAGAARFAR